MCGILCLVLVHFLALLVYFRIYTGKYRIKTSQKGKVALVTGGTAGIGQETAYQLAASGAKVYIVCRNVQKGESVARELRKKTFNNDIHVIKCDLSDFSSVRKCGKEFLELENELNILVNNAGVSYVSGNRHDTKDGLEEMMQANHFGHFLLTNLLLERLKKAGNARIVNVSSLAAALHGTEFDPKDTNFQHAAYSGTKAYGWSKMANILFTKELARKLEDTNITVNCLHPGAIASELGRNLPGVLYNIHIYLVGVLAFLGLFKTVKQGAATQLYLATSDEVSNVSGEYFKDCAPAALPIAALDRELAYQLWEESEKITGLVNSSE